jgi:hypothetical protein
MTIKYTRNIDGDFVCPDCGIIKKRQNSMHYHMKKHLEELQYSCKLCNKGFLQKQTLDLHIRSKHPELIKTQKGNEEEKKFNCPFDDCTFKALTKGNCIIHCLRIHFQDEMQEIMNQQLDTKSIICNKCNNEFNSSSSFYYHSKSCLTFNKMDEKYKVFEKIL